MKNLEREFEIFWENSKIMKIYISSKEIYENIKYVDKIDN